MRQSRLFTITAALLAMVRSSWVGMPIKDDLGWVAAQEWFYELSFTDEGSNFFHRSKTCMCAMVMHKCLWAYRLANELPFYQPQELAPILGASVDNKFFFTWQEGATKEQIATKAKNYMELYQMVGDFLRGCADDMFEFGHHTDRDTIFYPYFFVRWQLCLIKQKLSHQNGKSDEDPSVNTVFKTMARSAYELRRSMNGCVAESVYGRTTLLKKNLTNKIFGYLLREMRGKKTYIDPAK